MTLMGYTSRNIPSPAVFENVLDTRMKAKAEGNKALNYALKLVVNTTYGAMLNFYNDLYDPLMGRSVCITGQLFLLELAEHCYQEIPDLKIVQLNTDGIMIEFDDEYYPDVLRLTQEWQDRTGFELEEDKIVKIVQKDVNNYIEVQENGKAKSKGGYLVRGIAPAGAFNINNNASIIATAIREYFLNGTPVEKTVNDCGEIFQFQLIAKAGSKYSRAYQIIDGQEVPTQKVNRVYATSDTRYGRLYKVKAETGAVAKIESLPDHCIVDNDNHLTIDSVDKSYYIKQAQKKINDFLGIKPEKKGKKTMSEIKNPDTNTSVATEAVHKEPEKPEKPEKKETKTRTSGKVKTENVYSKLLKARELFLTAGASKSGKNMHLQFTYFELDDIVPIAIKAFAEVGIIPLVTFSETTAEMEIVNIDNPDESVVFKAPFNQIKPIISNTGKMATNEMQALGSSITYMRRYLYMIALDICEADTIDANIGALPTPEPVKAPGTLNLSPSTPAPAPANNAPVTQEKRTAIVNALTDTDGPASELQIKGLKGVLVKLRAKDNSQDGWITQIALQTNGFTVIKKSDCEALIAEATRRMS